MRDDDRGPMKPRRALAGRVCARVAAVLAVSLLSAATVRAQAFTDWRVDCAEDGRQCTAAITSFAEDRTWLSTLRLQPASRTEETLPVQILVPPGVHLASGLFVSVRGQGRAEATYLTCSPQACDARMSLDDRGLEAWKRARVARVLYRPSSTAPPIEYEVSLMGLTAALGAAAGEADR